MDDQEQVKRMQESQKVKKERVEVCKNRKDQERVEG